MRRLHKLFGLVMIAVFASALLAGPPVALSAGDENATPKFSTFASAEDLAAEVKILVADLEKAVASKEEYGSQVEGRFTRDGNTVTLIAIALGLHDQDSPLKPHAKAIAAAAQKLAQTKDFATTQQAVADLRKAVDGQTSGGGELKWGKVATLNSLMNDEVPGISTKLKTGLRHFKRRPAEVSANAATMALIAENARLYIGDTKKPTEGAKWTAFASQMQSAAGDLAAKAHAGDEAGATAAMDRLDRSCHDCHAVFNPDKP